VGFGISRAEHVQAVASLGADAAVIGSAIIDLIDRTPPDERAGKVREYLGTLSGRRRPTAD
jgi:tryptophan synthase alpha chain